MHRKAETREGGNGAMTGRHHFATAGVGSHRRGEDLCTPLRAGVVAVLVATSASASVLKVGDDGVQCANAGYTTIQAAVAAAAGGNTIQRNTISGSFNHDCHDATSGPGTAGT